MVEGEYQDLAREIETNPVYQILGLRIIAVTKGLCKIWIPINPKILNPFREIDSKVYFMGCNAAAFVASYTVLETEHYPESVNSQISILSGEAQNHLTITAIVNEAVDTQYINSEVSVVDETGKMVVTANFRFRRQMGNKSSIFT